ncbi:hypothetical protein MGSAQ_001679 [marine sediment metagenome]|uniref:Uncharacterized protein n=1 Tax=marine sediment metagenome TaxID=412755 RepID=A0A1B6NTM5_9ZZZZ
MHECRNLQTDPKRPPWPDHSANAPVGYPRPSHRRGGRG